MSKERRCSEGREDEKGSSSRPWCFQKALTALTKSKERKRKMNSSHRAAVTGPGSSHLLDLKRCHWPLSEEAGLERNGHNNCVSEVEKRRGSHCQAGWMVSPRGEPQSPAPGRGRGSWTHFILDSSFFPFPT